MRIRCDAGEPAGTGSARNALVGGALTIGGSLLLATILLVFDGPLTEAIVLTMLPGILVIGVQWISLRDRPWRVKLALIGGTLVVLFLIGLVAGLIRNG